MEIDLSINCDNVEGDFRRIATELMNRWVIKVAEEKYRITEIEFYYKNEFHSDPYIHGHVQQLEKGKWYFHGSGIDLTFGDGEAYGGILIRAIYNINRKKYHYGPLNCVQEIFRNFSNIYETKLSFGLAPSKEGQFESEKPISAPRVGLNAIKDPEMCNKLYRFLIMPKQKHADKTKIAEAMHSQNYSVAEIQNIWG
jgi:hypothetical protein